MFMKKFLLAIVTLLALNTSFGQPMHLLPSVSLHAWYPFCSATDQLDRTFSGFDLLGANLTGTTDRYGRANKAYSFNGLNSEMHYSTTFTIPAFGIADFTYSCHIYPTVVQDAIILYNGDPSNNGLGIIMNNGVFGGGAGNQISMLFGGIAQSTGFPVTLNQWHHVLMRRNGNSYLLFVDGVMVVTYVPPVTPGYNPPTTFFQLGIDFTALTKAYTGKIDDIAIYDRQVSNPEVLLIRDFDPNISFSLGLPLLSTCEATVFLGGTVLADTMVDTVTYPNRIYYPPTSSAYALAYQYQWSTGDSASWISLHFPFTPVPDSTRSLTITRQNSCPGQQAITVHHTVPVVNIGRDSVFCSGDSLLMNPAGMTAPGISYLWNTGDTTPSVYADTTFRYILLVDSLGCYGSDTADIVVSPHITVHLANDTTLCQGGTVTLRSGSPYVNPTYTWSDGITTSDTFVVSTTGTYWLSVEDSSCTASDTINVIIVYDTLTIFTPDTAICKGAFVIARASASPDPNMHYQWTPTAGISISDIPTTTIVPDTSATYVLEGKIKFGGVYLSCRTRDTLRIDVQPVPKVDMGGNRNVCEFDSIRITPKVTPEWYTLYSYDWTPGTFLDDSTAPNAIFTAGDTTKIVLVVTTPAGCTQSDSIIIYKYNGNFASMSPDTAICPGDSVVFMPSSSEPGITSYVWHPSTYLNDSTASNAVIKPINSLNYWGVATSQYGCKDTLYYKLVVNPAAVVHLLDSAVLFPGESIHLNPITNCHYHTWTPAVGLNDSTLSDPVATPPVNTKYILTAVTEDGCRTKDSIGIRVVPYSIISVPNAFVPGSYNSTLKVILRGLARLRYFRVYNRWGNLVFEGRDINDGWDGKFNGKAQVGGVYIYEAEAVTSEGQIIRKQGNVTLIE
jgi:hypothetical protein